MMRIDPELATRITLAVVAGNPRTYSIAVARLRRLAW